MEKEVHSFNKLVRVLLFVWISLFVCLGLSFFIFPFFSFKVHFKGRDHHNEKDISIIPPNPEEILQYMIQVFNDYS